MGCIWWEGKVVGWTENEWEVDVLYCIASREWLSRFSSLFVQESICVVYVSIRNLNLDSVMYHSPFGYPPPSNPGMVPSTYMGVVSNYDHYNSIPFPFIGCSIDPSYEMLWCSSQNEGIFILISLVGFLKRIFSIKSSVAVFCRSYPESLYL